MFRVPSPTESEEEEIATLENNLPNYNPDLGNNSDHVSRLGDSSSLFGTPSSTAFTFRSPGPNMVVEREPPKAALSPRKDNQQPPLPPVQRVQQQQPEFGKTSPLQNRLKSDNVFNIPKPHKAHPEWHRTAQPVFQSPNIYKPSYTMPEGPHGKPSYLIPNMSKPAYALQANGDVVEIPRPSNFTPEAT